MSTPVPRDLEAQPWPTRSLWPSNHRRDPSIARRGAALCRALLAARHGCYPDDNGAIVHGPNCTCEPPI